MRRLTKKEISYLKDLVSLDRSRGYVYLDEAHKSGNQEAVIEANDSLNFIEDLMRTLRIIDLDTEDTKVDTNEVH